MAARNKPAGIRSLVYGVDKAKVGIESLSASKGRDGGVYPIYEAEHERFLAASLRSLTVRA